MAEIKNLILGVSGMIDSNNLQSWKPDVVKTSIFQQAPGEESGSMFSFYVYNLPVINVSVADKVVSTLESRLNDFLDKDNLESKTVFVNRSISSVRQKFSLLLYLMHMIGKGFIVQPITVAYLNRSDKLEQSITELFDRNKLIKEIPMAAVSNQNDQKYADFDSQTVENTAIQVDQQGNKGILVSQVPPVKKKLVSGNKPIVSKSKVKKPIRNVMLVEPSQENEEQDEQDDTELNNMVSDFYSKDVMHVDEDEEGVGNQ